MRVRAPPPPPFALPHTPFPSDSDCIQPTHPLPPLPRGGRYLVASMHSDSCGLATTPVLAALHHLAATRYPTHRLLLGIDANTFSDPSRPDPGPAAPGSRGGFCRTRSCPDVMDLRRTGSACPVNSAASFHGFFSGLGLASCWGDEGHLTAWTTCMARTFLQVPPPLRRSPRARYHVCVLASPRALGFAAARAREDGARACSPSLVCRVSRVPSPAAAAPEGGGPGRRPRRQPLPPQGALPPRPKAHVHLPSAHPDGPAHTFGPSPETHA
jgi:hypothetical protein